MIPCSTFKPSEDLEMSLQRITVKIPSVTPGWYLDAWKYLPRGYKAPHPIIIMAHGFCGIKEMNLAPCAEAFASAGYACIVFDYRRWGTSDRNIVDVAEQLQDFRTVIKYVRSQPEYDPGRVILWGTSLSGGHAITLASDVSLNIAAAVTQCPFTGVACKLPFSRAMVMTLCAAVYDWFRQILGLAPYYIPATGRPGTVGVLTYEHCLDRITETFPMIKQSQWNNQVSGASVFALMSYHPSSRASEIRCPLLMVVAEEDNLCDSSSTLKVAELAQGSIKVSIPTAGHFDLYSGQPHHEASLRAQMEFLQDNVPV
ncbi:AB hydrolase superfamily protein [Pleurotus pulmonarius]